MQITYGIGFEDFLSLTKPSSTRPQDSSGYTALLVFCGFLCAIGLFLLFHEPEGSANAPAALLFIGFGVITPVLTYFLSGRSLVKKQKQQLEALQTRYQTIHCRDRRTLDWTEQSFSVSCGCGVVARPWSELVAISENDRLIQLRTRSDAHLIPKSGFTTEGAVTEFRGLVLEKLKQRSPLTARVVQFAYTKTDFQQAKLLHMMSGGGWRPLLTSLLGIVCFIWLVAKVMSVIDRTIDPVAFAAITSILMTVLFVPYLIKARRKKRYLGPMTAYIGEEGIQLQDSVGGQSHTPWTGYVGYLEGKSCFLLYYSARLYRIFPKRIFTNYPQEEFRKLVTSKLPRFRRRT